MQPSTCPTSPRIHCRPLCVGGCWEAQEAGAEHHPQSKVPACCHVSAHSLAGGFAPFCPGGPKPSEGSDRPRHTSRQCWRRDKNPGTLTLSLCSFLSISGPRSSSSHSPSWEAIDMQILPTGDPGARSVGEPLSSGAGAGRTERRRGSSRSEKGRGDACLGAPQEEGTAGTGALQSAGCAAEERGQRTSRATSRGWACRGQPLAEWPGGPPGWFSSGPHSTGRQLCHTSGKPASQHRRNFPTKTINKTKTLHNTAWSCPQQKGCA